MPAFQWPTRREWLITAAICAVFGPIGKDGYFEPLFDKRTGVINKQVAAYWKEHYDLRYIMERDWKTLGPASSTQLLDEPGVPEKGDLAR